MLWPKQRITSANFGIIYSGTILFLLFSTLGKRQVSPKHEWGIQDGFHGVWDFGAKGFIFGNAISSITDGRRGLAAGVFLF
jgi:hypothetical protein